MYPSVSPNDNPTKDPYMDIIIRPYSVTSETPTKYTSHVQKELPSAKLSKFLIEYSSGYPTGAPRTMPTDKPSSNPSGYPSSDLDDLKRGSQEAQVSLQRNIIFSSFISPRLHPKGKEPHIRSGKGV